MSVKTLTSSNIQNTGKTRSIFASTGIPGFGFMAGDFESIATVTVGSGGAASIEFTNIPGTYQHLQVRLIGRGSDSGFSGGRYFNVRINSDSGANYSYHDLRGTGSGVAATGLASQTAVYGQRMTNALDTASVFGAALLDFLDYSDNTKNKTVRSLGGYDVNGGGYIYAVSGARFNTAAITTIALTLEAGNWVEHSTAALYGVKA